MRQDRRQALLIIASGILLGFQRAANASPRSASKPLLLATNPIVADWVKALIGDEAEVMPFLGPEAELHHAEPKPSQIALLERAHGFILFGLGVDEGLLRLIKQRAKGLAFFALGDQLPKERRIPLRAGHDHHRHHHHHGGRGDDPHFWLDPFRVAELIPELQRFLQKLFPAAADSIAERAAGYRNELIALGRHIKAQIDMIDPFLRVGLVPHQVFAYFNEAFATQLIGIDQAIPHGELSVQKLQKLRAVVTEQRIRYFFREHSRASRIAERVASELQLVAAGILYTETLAADDRGPQSYLAMMQHNTRELLAAWNKQ